MTCRSTLIGSLAAERHDLLFFEHAQQPRLQASGMSPISSRNSVPPEDCRILPFMPSLRAPVNAPEL